MNTEQPNSEPLPASGLLGRARLACMIFFIIILINAALAGFLWILMQLTWPAFIALGLLALLAVSWWMAGDGA